MIIKTLKPRQCQVKDCTREGAVYIPYQGAKLWVCMLCDAIIAEKIKRRSATGPKQKH